MKTQLLSGIIVLIILASPVFGEIYTGALAPQEAKLCYPYADTITITATDIFNTGTYTLNNIEATLANQPAAGGTLPQDSFTLGSLGVGEGSSTNPQWTVHCDDFEPGTYTLTVQYTSDEGQFSSEDQSIVSTLTVVDPDSVPQITNAEPTGTVQKNYATLALDTSIRSMCRASTTLEEFDDMPLVFESADFRHHTKLITQLTQKTHTYYVQCRSEEDIELAEPYTLTFIVDSPPTSTVEVVDETLLGAGSHTVILRTSEDVKPYPRLWYSLDGGSRKSVYLTGSGREWKGFIKINSGDDAKVAVFDVEAEDYSGNTGTLITEGNLFLVDTAKPPRIANLRTSLTSEGYVRVAWYYEGEDVDEYVVYRDTASGLDRTSEYSTITSREFTDTSVQDGRTYYYRISARDKAGNLGDLSEEVSLTIPGSTSQDDTTSVPITTAEPVPANSNGPATPPATQQAPSPQLDTTHATSSKQDAENLLSRLDDIRTTSMAGLDEEERALAATLGVAGTQVTAKAELQELVKEYDKLLNQKDQAGLDRELKRLNVRKKTIEKGIPTGFKITGENHIENNAVFEQMSHSVDKTYTQYRIGVAEGDEKRVAKLNEKILEKARILTKVQRAEITYLDGTVKGYLHVTKEVMSEEEDLLLIEDIPKQALDSAGKVEADQLVTIIEEDPVVAFTLNNQETLTYWFETEASPDAMNELHSALALRYPANDEKGMSITGLVTSIPSPGSTFVWSFLGIILIGVLLAYYLSDFKMEMPSLKTTPFRTKYDTSDDGLVQLKRSPSNVLYEKANRSIDNLQFDEANRIYFQLQQTSRNTVVKAHVALLRDKLFLYQKINEAVHYHKNKETERLREVLNQAAHAFNRIADREKHSSKLMQWAERWHSHCTDTMYSSS